MEEQKQKRTRVRYRSPERQLQDALNKAEQFAKDGAIASIADKRLLAQRIKALLILSARARHDITKKLREELAAANAEIERLKAAPTTTDNTAELENAKARIRELSRDNETLRRGSISRSTYEETEKAYKYLVRCVAGMANLDQPTRLRIWKHVIDVSGVPSEIAYEFNQLLGRPSWPKPKEPEIESVKQPR